MIVIEITRGYSNDFRYMVLLKQKHLINTLVWCERLPKMGMWFLIDGEIPLLF